MDFDAEIANREAEVAGTKQEMARTQRALVIAVGHYLKTYYPKTARTEVERNGPAAQKLDDKTLKELKTRVAELTDKADEVARELFDRDDSLWWHRTGKAPPRDQGSGSSNYRISVHGAVLPDPLLRPMRRALGRVGDVLRDFKIIDSTGGSIAGPWKLGSSTDTVPFQGLAGEARRPRLEAVLAPKAEEAPAIVDAAKKYAELHFKAERLIREIEDLHTNKTKAAAATRWDAV